MKGSGQRHEVVFLAVAVAVLTIAVAVFVGVRITANKSKPTPKPPVEQPVATKPEPPAPTPVDRDPFKSGTATDAAAASKSATEMKLVGIVMSGDRPLAVIRRGTKRYYAKLGERAGSYTVAGIGRDRVELVKGEERITLTLHTPEPEEEAEE